jgi:hypothetical protein
VLRCLCLLIYFQSVSLFAADIVARWVALDVWPAGLPNVESMTGSCQGQLPALTSREWLLNPNSSVIAVHSLGVKASYHKFTVKGQPGERVVLSSSLPLVDKGFACLISDQGQSLLTFDSARERRGYPSFAGTVGQNGELTVEALLLAERPVSPMILTRAYAPEIEEYASLLYWILIGGLTSILLYNLFLWLGAKKPLYMINVIYISAILSLNFVFSFGFFAARNLWMQLGWGHHELLIRVLNALGNPSGLLASTYVIHFSIQYCDIATLSQRLARVLRIIFIFGVTLSIAGFLYICVTNDPGKMNSISRYLGTFNSLTILGTAAYAGFWRKHLFGRILFFSYLPLTVGTSIFVSYLEGRIVGDNIFTRNSLLIGSFFESLILSYSVGFRFRLTEEQARSKTEELSEKLQRINVDLEQKVTLATGEIRAMLQNIGEAIFIVSLGSDGDIKLSEQMSDHTWQLFPELDPGRNPGFDTFLKNLQLSQETKTRLKSLVVASIGEDPLVFQMNEDLAPRVVRSLKDEVLEMTMDPIVSSDHKVQRLLITLKDISARIEHERHRMQEEEQNQILLELIKCGLSRIERHLFVLEKALRFSESALLSKEDGLRSLHTAKGVARSWGFRLFSERIHALEEAVIRDGITTQNALKDAQRIHAQYESIYRDRLMRSQDNEQHEQELRFEALKLALERLDAPASDEYKKQVTSLLAASMTGAEFLGEILGRFQEEVDRLSQQMDKAACRMEVVNDQMVKLPKESSVIFIGILGHLIRNSLDHGMESETERRRLGKDLHGILRLRILENSAERLSFQFWDDGKGLDLLAIQRKAQNQGITEVDCVQALELIFENQFSSKDQVSIISGRGLGLDAVRQAAQDTGGRAFALVQDDPTSGVQTLIFQIELGLKKQAQAA